jgi:GDP/UDP-N,N'-diacetylbacillosamine 2-epimerase (hydrolysing)
LKKKILFITGSRAEYGQFSHFLHKIHTSKKINFKLIVTGMHLYKKFGLTYKEILKDNIKIYKKIYINSNNDDNSTVPLSFALAIKKFNNLFKKEKPDLVLLPCDRYEILAAGMACFFNNIPVIHFYGGDTSLGSQDEFYRTSISNIAKYHFVSHKEAKKKLMQKNDILSKYIFNFGAISLDQINNIKLISKKLIENKIGIDLNHKTILFTYHPITTNQKLTIKEIDTALKSLKKLKGINIIFTAPNNDKGHDYIIKKIKEFCKKDTRKFKFFNSLGRQLYFSLIKHCKIVCGNSSSLLYEIPYFKKYSLNIGERQKNRVSSNTVINVKPILKNIDSSFHKYLKIKEPTNVINPFYVVNSTEKILKTVYKIINRI